MHYLIVIINLSAFISGTFVSYCDGAYDPAAKQAAERLGRRCEECGHYECNSYCDCPSSSCSGKGYIGRNVNYGCGDDGYEHASESSSYGCGSGKGSDHVSYSSAQRSSSGYYGSGGGGGYVISGGECDSRGGGYASGAGGGKRCSTGPRRMPIRGGKGCNKC